MRAHGLPGREWAGPVAQVGPMGTAPRPLPDQPATAPLPSPQKKRLCYHRVQCVASGQGKARSLSSNQQPGFAMQVPQDGGTKWVVGQAPIPCSVGAQDTLNSQQHMRAGDGVHGARGQAGHLTVIRGAPARGKCAPVSSGGRVYSARQRALWLPAAWGQRGPALVQSVERPPPFPPQPECVGAGARAGGWKGATMEEIGGMRPGRGLPGAARPPAVRWRHGGAAYGGALGRCGLHACIAPSLRCPRGVMWGRGVSQDGCPYR
jgi:hypothetical protein